MQLPQSVLDDSLTSEQIMQSSGLSQFHMTDEELEKSVIGKLHIVAVEGRNLAIKDITGSSDPYIIFKTSSNLLKTTTIYKNLNPIWNEQFNVEVHELSEELEVCVMDEDLFKYDDFMGKFSVSIKELKSGKEMDQWYKLYPRKWNEKVSGEIRLRLTFESFEEERENKKMIHLKDILNDSFSVQYFHDFLVKECSEENLLFHESVEEFKKKITSFNGILVEKDYNTLYDTAFGIFETFLKPNGNFEINIEFYIKEEYIKIFENKIETVAEMKKFSNLKFFDNAQIRTISIMELTFPNFLKSEEYESLLEKILWTQKFQYFQPLSRTESLSRLIHTFTEQDLNLMETLIKKKKKGTLSFKKPILYAQAITDSPKEEEQEGQDLDDDDDSLEFKKGDVLKIIRMDHLTGYWLCEFKNRIGYVPNILLTTNIKQNESSTSITSTDFDNKLFRAKSYLKSFSSADRQSFQNFFQEQKTSSGKIIRAGNLPKTLQDSYFMIEDEGDQATSLNVHPSEFDFFKSKNASKSMKEVNTHNGGFVLTKEEEDFIKKQREEKMSRISKIKSSQAISLSSKVKSIKEDVMKKDRKFQPIVPTIVEMQMQHPKEKVENDKLKIQEENVEQKEVELKMNEKSIIEEKSKVQEKPNVEEKSLGLDFDQSKIETNNQIDEQESKENPNVKKSIESPKESPTKNEGKKKTEIGLGKLKEIRKKQINQKNEEIKKESKKKAFSINLDKMSAEDESILSPSRVNSSFNLKLNDSPKKNDIERISKRASKSALNIHSSRSDGHLHFEDEPQIIQGRQSARERKQSQVHKLISTFERFSKKKEEQPRRKSDFFGHKYEEKNNGEIISNSSLLSFSNLK
eukprot:gene2967-4977_t